MPKLADAFRQFGPAYVNEYEDTMPIGHRKALKAILACHTDALGGSVHTCNDCDHKRYIYHSCRNRACPKCQNEKTDVWAESLREKLLPVPHFHLIFTLPSEIRRLMRSNQRIANAVLMKASYAALSKLAKGRLGAVSVLHTWSRSLVYHSHIHMMVPAGWVSDDGSSWIRSNPSYLVPVKALKSIFRAIFVKMIRKELPEVILPQSIWHKEWNVRVIPFTGGVDNLINYLARYIYRVAISDNRIVEVTDSHVVFRADKGTMKLAGSEFIRRFLQHVPPKGFHKVRYFGIMHASNTNLRARIKLTLPPLKTKHTAKPKRHRPVRLVCAKCGGTHITIGAISPFYLTTRAPP